MSTECVILYFLVETCTSDAWMKRTRWLAIYAVSTLEAEVAVADANDSPVTRV